MIRAQNIFKVGAKYVDITLWVYATDYGVRRAVGDYTLRALCRKNMDGKFHIVVSRKAFSDGTLEHEIAHVVQMSGIKAHEKQASLVEQVTPWARAIIQ
jgi:hypothetical protein